MSSFSIDVSGESAPVTVGFNDTSQGAVTAWQWDFGDGATSTEQNPTHEYTMAGPHTVRLAASGPGGTGTSIMSDFIAVEPGPPVSLEGSPSSATLAVQEGTQFTAVARDEFGNVAPGTFDWAMDGEGGSITGDGLFTADTAAGAFADTVQARLHTESGELLGSASVTVVHGPLSRVVVEPAVITMDIGATQSFSFTALDAFDNETADVIAAWTVPPDVGTIDANGTLTAGTKAGPFSGAVRLEVFEGSTLAAASLDVVVLPGPLATIKIVPPVATVVSGSTQEFTATGSDQYSNPIPGLAFLWGASGGEIGVTGVLTAGMAEGIFDVEAYATYKDGEVNAKSTVFVTPVAFANTGVLTGQILYNREPLSTNTDWVARFSMAGPQPFAGFITLYNPATGAYALLNLPESTFRIWVDISSGGRGAYISGGFQGYGDVTVPAEAPIVSHDLTVVENIHLVSPVDNSQEVDQTRQAPKAYPSSQLLFEWEPMAAASFYKITAYTQQEASNSAVAAMAEKTISGTQWRPTLTPSLSNESYGFCLSAYSPEGEEVGVLRIARTNGAGTCYHFRIAPG